MKLSWCGRGKVKESPDVKEKEVSVEKKCEPEGHVTTPCKTTPPPSVTCAVFVPYKVLQQTTSQCSVVIYMHWKRCWDVVCAHFLEQLFSVVTGELVYEAAFWG